jgi:hypothetical protein
VKTEGLGFTRTYKVHLYFLKEHRKLPPYIPRPDSQPVPLELIDTALYRTLTVALVRASLLSLFLILPIICILFQFSLVVISL